MSQTTEPFEKWHLAMDSSPPRRHVPAAPSRDNPVRLRDLCQRDKAKVGRLMQELVKVKAEKDQREERLLKLRAQNEEIISEMAEVKTKFAKTLQLLHKYQELQQEHQQQIEALRDSLDAAQQEAAQQAEERSSLEEQLRNLELAHQQVTDLQEREREAMSGDCQRAHKQLDEERETLEAARAEALLERSKCEGLQRQLEQAEARRLREEADAHRGSTGGGNAAASVDVEDTAPGAVTEPGDDAVKVLQEQVDFLKQQLALMSIRHGPLASRLAPDKWGWRAPSRGAWADMEGGAPQRQLGGWVPTTAARETRAEDVSEVSRRPARRFFQDNSAALVDLVDQLEVATAK